MKKKIMITSRIRGRDKGTGVNKTTRVPNVISLRSVTPWRTNDLRDDYGLYVYYNSYISIN